MQKSQIKKFLTIAIIFVFALLLVLGIFTYVEHRSRALQIHSALTRIQLTKIRVSILSFINNNRKFPDNLDDLYKKQHSSEDINWLQYRKFSLDNKKLYEPFLFDEAIDFKQEYPPNTIIVSEPVAFENKRWVILLKGLKGKPSQEIGDGIKRISEKDFQAQIKKQKWKIPEKNQEVIWP